MIRNGLRKSIRPVGEALASGQDGIRAQSFLKMQEVFSTVYGDRFRLGRIRRLPVRL